jgi:two-component system, OmpR family, response regulator TctD
MENKPRVLIIEDHDILRVMLFAILRNQPLDVDTAVSADSAMEKVETCDYALILIDLDLENADAASFLSRFRERRPEAQTFIIAVRDPSRETFGNLGGISAVLNKPLEIGMLADVVRACAIVAPPSLEDHEGCPPAESDVRSSFPGPMHAN